MMTKRRSVEWSVRDFRHRTRKKYSAEVKIRIVLEGLRAEVAALKETLGQVVMENRLLKKSVPRGKQDDV